MIQLIHEGADCLTCNLVCMRWRSMARMQILGEGGWRGLHRLGPQNGRDVEVLGRVCGAQVEAHVRQRVHVGAAAVHHPQARRRLRDARNPLRRTATRPRESPRVGLRVGYPSRGAARISRAVPLAAALAVLATLRAQLCKRVSDTARHGTAPTPQVHAIRVSHTHHAVAIHALPRWRAEMLSCALRALSHIKLSLYNSLLF